MDALTLVLIYIMGILTGGVGFMTLTIFYANKVLNREKKSLDKLTKKKSIEDRMKRVKEITNDQLDMLQQTDGPQKNALDGKHKNNVNSVIKQLEEEKTDILQSILAEGHDPEITTIDQSGVITKMKLSDFMVYSGIDVEPKKVEPPKSKQLGKFTVYKGGKDDSDDSGTTH